MARENLARAIFAQMQGALGDAVEVAEVRLAEDETLSSTYRGE